MIIILFFLATNPDLNLVWTNTGDLPGAVRVAGLTLGLNGYLYAGAQGNPNPGSGDSGWVYVSQDLWNWQVGGNLPGNQDGVYCLFNGAADTLYAGTGMWGDLPLVFKSGDGAQNWTALNNYGTIRPGTRVNAFIEDRQGIFHLGNNYMGMSAAIPRRSTDRGATWLVDSGTINYNSLHYCLYQSSDNTLYLGSWGGGGVHRSYDNGAHWSPAAALPGVSDCYTIIEVGADTVFAGAESSGTGKVYKTTDHGDAWTQMGAGYLSGASAVRTLLYTPDFNYTIFCGTAPNAEVFSSVDKGATWTSTGTLSGATTVYKLVEVRKVTASAESLFLYAATGPNGDVYRSLLQVIIKVDEDPAGPGPDAGVRVLPNPFASQARIPGHDRDLLPCYDVRGSKVGEYRGDKIGWDLRPGVYFVRLNAKDGARYVKLLKTR